MILLAEFTCIGFIFMKCHMPDTAPVVVCPRPRPWPAAEQKAVADELAALPEGSASARAIGAYINLRDQARACRTKVGS